MHLFSTAAIVGRTNLADARWEGLAVDKLARLNVTGGNIRNIALQAAFLAAGENRPVTMRHHIQAAGIDKPMASFRSRRLRSSSPLPPTVSTT